MLTFASVRPRDDDDRGLTDDGNSMEDTPRPHICTDVPIKMNEAEKSPNGLSD